MSYDFHYSVQRAGKVSGSIERLVVLRINAD